MIKLDFTDHAPAVQNRPTRSRTSAIVLHRTAEDDNLDGVTTFSEVVRFYTKDPEGVATVVLPGAYVSKLPQIRDWRARGVPAATKERAFVPYHFLIEASGEVARMLPLAVRGAHAGAWNDRSVGIAILGNFELHEPTAAQVDAVLELIKDIRTVYPRAAVLGHDDTLTLDGMPPKGCPGRFFPLAHVKELVG